jgi:hypothetical protein
MMTTIDLRVSKTDLKRWKKAADTLSLPVGSWARMVLLMEARQPMRIREGTMEPEVERDATFQMRVGYKTKMTLARAARPLELSAWVRRALNQEVLSRQPPEKRT